MNQVTELDKIVSCSDCWTDFGLRSVAKSIGKDLEGECSSCKSQLGRKLTRQNLYDVCNNFFVNGSTPTGYGFFAPIIQVNDRYGSSHKFGTKELNEDIKHLELDHGIYCFHYGPPMWMLGKPPDINGDVIWNDEDFALVLNSCQDRLLSNSDILYRVRLNLSKSDIVAEKFCAPPNKSRSKFSRFDSEDLNVCYTALDVETCLHEMRMTLQDDIFAATMSPTRTLRLLDLTTCSRSGGTPFEDPLIWLSSLLYGGVENYQVCRQLAQKIKDRTYDGFVYKSYFQQAAERTHINVALFGEPIANGTVKVNSINVIRVKNASYDWNFGPVILGLGEND